MTARGQGHGQGNGQGKGRGRGADGGMQPDRPSGDMQSDDLGGRQDDTLDDTNRPVDKGMDLGRSEDSPGHRKQAAGAQSARDFAPGRARRA